MKKIIILAIVLFAITIAKAEKTATLNIKKNEFHKDKATRDIFGGFIELVSNFINGENGLWAQELVNRGFDHIIYPAPNTKGEISNWKIYLDTLKSSSIDYWNDGYNINGRFCLKFEQNNDVHINIQQDILLTDSVDYEFYIYAKKKDNNLQRIKVSLEALDLNGKKITLASELVIINSFDWVKYSTKLIVNKNVINVINNSTKLKIESLDKGIFYIDEVSLMPSNNINGVRKEQYDLYQKAKFANLRYPGGSFADSKLNDWKNTILPIDQRKSPLMLGFNDNPQRFEFGLREYIHFCKDLNIEPYLTVNYQNGTPEEAEDLVEFCNGDTSSVYGKIRMKLGDTLPYKVKYWEIGNEQWDNKEEYAKGYVKFYDKMKLKDSSIIAIIDGNCWDDDSFDGLMNIVNEKCQIFGYHPAKGFDSVSQNDGLRYLQSVDASFEEYIIDFYKKKIDKFKLNDKLFLGSTEWWSSGSDGRTWLYDNTPMNSSLNAALWNANMLMIYLSNPDIMKVACRTIGLGMIKKGTNSTGKRTIYGSPSFNAFSMLSNHFGENLHKINFETEIFNNHDVKNWIDNMKMTDVVVTSSRDSIYASYINKYPNDEVKLYLNIDGIPLQTNGVHYELWANDYKVQNTVEYPNNVIEKSNGIVSIRGKYNFRPHSFNILAIPIKYVNNLIELIPIDTNLPINNDLTKINIENINLFYSESNNQLQIMANEYYYNMNIEVFGVNGESIASQKYDLVDGINSLVVDLASGVYYTKISDKYGNFIVKPFVVQN